MAIKLKLTAMGVMAAAFAAALLPPTPIMPSVWAQDAIYLADGPNKGDKFDLKRTPYLREVLDFFADATPGNKASVRKSKQTGFSTAAIILTGYTAAQEPCDLFLIEPTDSNLRDFIDEKLQPTIDGSPAFAAAIKPQVSRSGKGSTTYTKRFNGGSLLMSVASSAAELRGKTRRKVIEDEASEYKDDLDGQGNPHDMIAGAYETFLKSGDWKHLKISTPVLKGECDIDREYEAGDQRQWHHICPHCRTPFAFKFDLKFFKFNDAYPLNAHYITQCCGCEIFEHQREQLMQNAERDGGGWIATAPGPGKHRSYHFDALSSPFVPWDTIAQRYLESKGNPNKEKTFYNLTLGLAYEMRGDAPDWQRLLERREQFREGHIPPRALINAIGADVQHNGIWVEHVGFAPNRENWSIWHEFLEGDTTDHNAGAFLKLAEIYDRKWPDAFGGMRDHDAMFVDAGDGGRANQVYAFCRTRSKAYAIKGMPGWTTPAIGTPSQVDVTVNGQKIKGGATLWPVGTWSLKALWYSDLRKDGIRSGAEIDPPGYVHLREGNDERYCKQVTAEYLETVTERGRTMRKWKEAGPNHLLDARIYAMAAAEMMGLTRLTEAQWAELARHRGMPAQAIAADLFTAAPLKVEAEGEMRESVAVEVAEVAREAAAQPPSSNWWNR